jgi:hypothetical protein
VQVGPNPKVKYKRTQSSPDVVGVDEVYLVADMMTGNSVMASGDTGVNTTGNIRISYIPPVNVTSGPKQVSVAVTYRTKGNKQVRCESQKFTCGGQVIPGDYKRYWSFDGSTYDYGPDGNKFLSSPVLPGSSYSSPSYIWEAPINNGYAHFSGNMFYCIDNSLTWTPTTFSVSWWHNADTLPFAGGYMHTIGAGDDPDAWKKFNFQVVDASGNGFVGIDDDTGPCAGLKCRLQVNPIFPSKNVWYHFVFTYDGSKGYFYRNGVSVGANSRPDQHSMPSPAAWSFFRIGDPCSMTGPMGDIDEVIIYPRALSETEVQQIFTEQRGKFGV